MRIGCQCRLIAGISGFLLLLAGHAHAEEYARALPGYAYDFPRDHGAHPPFRTEWWYYTGNLRADNEHEFGFELTFFRQRTAPLGNALAARTSLAADEIYFAHFAISDISTRTHRHWEQFGRHGLGQAFASTTTLNVRLDNWYAILNSDPASSGAICIFARVEDASLSLTLVPQKPLVIHGRHGVHQKADDPGRASHYYSFSRLATRGEIQWQGRAFHVAGQSWMDHEFGSDQLGSDTAGWDWFALQLDSGEELMLYQLRRKDGSYNDHSIGTSIGPDGASMTVPAESIEIDSTATWKSPESGAVYPQNWRIELPAYEGELIVTPCFADQEMRTQGTAATIYWEGAVRVSGRWRGRPVHGTGYVELTGYAGPLRGL